MSQVLTSHSSFKKRSDLEVSDTTENTSENGCATTPLRAHADVSAPRPSQPAEEQDFDDSSSEYDEYISDSELDDELERAQDDPYICEMSGEGAFTPAEAKAMRDLLRAVKADKFIEKIVTRDEIPIRKLATVWGVRPDRPNSDAWYYRLLGRAIQRELFRRQKLPQYNTIDDAVSLLKQSKNIIVITGAGISTSLGIPDFRSRNTGFYSQLRARGFDSPEDVFEINTFDEDPTHFYQLAKEILPLTDKYSLTHAFIRYLQDSGQLLTNYTQNIDNVEANAGIAADRLIQCHGSWATATCRKCHNTVPGEAIFEDLKAQRVALCKKCISTLGKQRPRKRKRGSNSSSRTRARSSHSDSEDDGQYDIPQPGVMKPGITFFGEKLPDTFFNRLINRDSDMVDLIVVIGTSMKVAPVSEIPNLVSSSVPVIYISLEPAYHINFDITLLGYCDVVVAELCRRAGWDLQYGGTTKSVATHVKADERKGHWIVVPEPDVREDMPKVG
ncbi:hypothetical protein MBLNU459_g6928t1 [Dothideomycetes sp. NU459]